MQCVTINFVPETGDLYTHSLSLGVQDDGRVVFRSGFKMTVGMFFRSGFNMTIRKAVAEIPDQVGNDSNKTPFTYFQINLFVS